MAAQCAAGVCDLLALRDDATEVDRNDPHAGGLLTGRVAGVPRDPRPPGPLAEGKLLASAGPDSTALVINQRGPGRWALKALKVSVGSCACIVSFSDGRLSPLGDASATAFTISARGPELFDSQVEVKAVPVRYLDRRMALYWVQLISATAICPPTAANASAAGRRRFCRATTQNRDRAARYPERTKGS